MTKIDVGSAFRIGAIVAWVNNLAARWVGGIRLQLDADGSDLLYDIERDAEKRKRGEI